MDKTFEIRLIEALDALEAGEPLEHVLARYPDDAAALRPILETAMVLPTLRQEPPPMAEVRSRRAFLQAARVFQQAARRPIWQGLLRTLGTAAVSAAMVVAVGAGMLALSASALPGDALYPIKRNFETVRLLLAPEGERQVFVRELRQTRLQEIQALLAAGREVRVVFEGKIEAMLPDHWVVDGIVVHVDEATLIEGTPLPGLEVEVDGLTRQGALYATSIRVLTEVTLTPSPTPSPLPTASPSPTPTLTPTPRIIPTATPSPTATFAPPPPATSPPAATDDGDDAGDDRDDDDKDGDDKDDRDDRDDRDDNSGPGSGDGDDDNDNDNDNDDD